MAVVRCVDGAQLSVVPVPVRDRGGAAYEVVLHLLLDGEPLGEVGERCYGLLTAIAQQLRAPAVPAAAVPRPLARDVELLSLRARDPDDVAPSEGGSAGELRAWLRQERRWLPVQRRWEQTELVVLDAWGAGRGVRAQTDLAGLRRLLDDLLAEADAGGATGPHG